MPYEPKPSAGMGDPLRPDGPCVKCGHPQIVRSRIKEQRMSQGRIMVFPLVMARGLIERVKKDWFGNVQSKQRLQAVDQPHGELEAYACLACGYVEWYANNPQDIPIGPSHHAELLVYHQRYR